MATFSSFPQKPPIYLYSEPFVTADACVTKMEASLYKYGIKPSRVIKVDAGYLTRELTRTQQATLILPGGSTLLLTCRLSKNIESIQNVVSSGWNFLGSCAGANYPCSKLSIKYGKHDIKDWENEIEQIKDPDAYAAIKRERTLLHLLPLHADSPAYPILTTGRAGVDNKRTVKVYSARYASELPVVWAEGSIFHPQSGSESLQVEASYTDIEGNPACAYSGLYGKGRVVVTAVHPEFTEEKDPLHPLLSQFFELTI